MDRLIRIGRGRSITNIPQVSWEEALARAPARIGKRLDFMSRDHHRVRNYVVRELPRAGRPIRPQILSRDLDLSPEQVATILDELEKRLFFLVRNGDGDVSWAYPVTVDDTGHHLVFSTGERLDAAWAEDAIATPFVQGRLRGGSLSVEIRTRCARSGERIRIVVDGDLNCRVVEGDSDLLVFEPDVDWDTFEEPNIIDGYWRRSLFFWSEEHAREYRIENEAVDGTYLTLEQSVYSTRIAQGALFGFHWAD